jgi:hypothetical protein
MKIANFSLMSTCSDKSFSEKNRRSGKEDEIVNIPVTHGQEQLELSILLGTSSVTAPQQSR